MRYQKLQQVFEVQSIGLDTGTQSLLLVYIPVDDTLFDVSPEIRCSDVSSRCCCYGDHAAGSWSI